MHIFLISAPAEGEWSASRHSRFTPGERAQGTHWIGSWVGSRAGLDNVKKRKFLTLPELELQPLGHPVHSQSLYRLSYPGSPTVLKVNVGFYLFICIFGAYWLESLHRLNCYYCLNRRVAMFCLSCLRVSIFVSFYCCAYFIIGL
jgi:hypothetical protein